VILYKIGIAYCWPPTQCRGPASDARWSLSSSVTLQGGASAITKGQHVTAGQ